MAKIYFALCADAGAVKVGWAVDVTKRLVQHQCGCPFELTTIFEMDGDARMERRIHLALTGHGIRGEWFNETAVREFIADVTAQGVESAIAARMDIIAARRRVIELRSAMARDAIAKARPDLLATRQAGHKVAAELMTNRHFSEQLLGIIHEGKAPNLVAMAARRAA